MTKKDIIETIEGMEWSTGPLTPYGPLAKHPRIEDIVNIIEKMGGDKVINDIIKVADDGGDPKYAFYKMIYDGQNLVNFNSTAVRDVLRLAKEEYPDFNWETKAERAIRTNKEITINSTDAERTEVLINKNSLYHHGTVQKN